jgi:DNA-binding beta-propeller fold protein YncE
MKLELVVTLCLSVAGACGDGGPLGPEGSQLARRVFIACADSTLGVFDVDQGVFLDAVPLPGSPISVATAPTGGRVYVGLSDPGGIVEVDAASLRIVRTISTPSMSLGLDVTPDGSLVLGTNSDEGLVTVVSLSSGQMVDTVRIGLFPQYLRLDPTGSRAYVAVYGNDQLAVLRTADLAVEAFVPLGDMESGPGGVAVSPDGGTIYVGTYDFWYPSILIVSASPPTVLGRAIAGNGSGGGAVDVEVTPDGRKVMMARPGGVAVVDLISETLVTTIPVPAFALAMPRTGDVFYAVGELRNWQTGESTDELHVIRSDDHTVVSTYAACHSPAVAANF